MSERVEAPSGPGVRRWTAAAALLVVLTAPIGVARRPLAAGDEAREAAVVQNMLATGNWRKNLVGGEVLYEKPPFFYMSVAAAARATGSLSPLSARLPSVFFAALALGATALAGGALFSRRAGIVAMLLLATTYLFLINAHNCLIDVPVLGFVTLGLAAFVARQRRGAPRWDGWWGLAAAGALLAKGLIGPTLLILLTLPFWWFSAERRPLWRSVSTGALALPLAALALWIGVTWSALGGHGVYQVLWVNNVGRFLGFAEPGYSHHRAGFLYYLPLLPGLVFPWTLLLAGALARAWRRDGRQSLRPLASGLLAALLLLSVAGTKRTVYLLPLVPVAALLSAGYLEAVWRRPTRGQRLLLAAQAVLAAAGVAAAVLAARAAPQGDPDAELFRAMAQRLSPDVPFYAYNVNLDILGKALLEMPRPPREEYSVERLVAVCQKEPTFVLSEVEHLREPHVAPLRQVLLPLYVGKSADKVVALYRTRTR